jgi:hypothetical protein
MNEHISEIIGINSQIDLEKNQTMTTPTTALDQQR